MKTITVYLVAIIMMVTLLQRCIQNDDIENQNPERVQFTISKTSPGKSAGRMQSGTLPENALLVLSIENSNGETVFTNQPVRIESSSDGYSTEPVELPSGSFKVTDFMIVDQYATVLYATPKPGSPLASVVTRTLSRALQTEQHKVSTIAMEVIEVGNLKPENFGYASFKICDYVFFQVAVFKAENGKTQITNATGYITHDDDTLHVYPLAARVNPIFFQGDPKETYTLTVRKNAYESYRLDFKPRNLIKDLRGKPLKITLKPANKAKLKAFVLNSRRYEFYYNKKDAVDSIVATEGSLRYIYYVVYTGGRIDSVSTINNGHLESIYDAFEYDTK